MRLNGRQKSLLIKILSKEWEEAQWREFNLSMESKNERSSNFNKQWKESIQYTKDIEKIIELCNDEISKKIYFLPKIEKVKKEMDVEYHEIMSNK